MTLRESKQIIRTWIRERFSDEKLAAVYAFNQDGRMQFLNPCTCLIGVSAGKHLHRNSEECANRFHYFEARYNYRGAGEVESAYNVLGHLNPGGEAVADRLRQRRLSAILRAEMRRRARKPVTELAAV